MNYKNALKKPKLSTIVVDNYKNGVANNFKNIVDEFVNYCKTGNLFKAKQCMQTNDNLKCYEHITTALNEACYVCFYQK